MAYDESDSEEDSSRKEASWDPRWLDAVIKADLESVVYYLARPNHKGVVTYLLNLAAAKDPADPGGIVEALARCQYPKITDVFLDLVARKTKVLKQYDYALQTLLESARHLPASDLPRLDEFAAKLGESKIGEQYVDRFLEALAPLRPTTQPN